jgi:hypothetical protein
MSRQREAGVNVGVHVGKQQLGVFIHERALHFTVTNDPAGIRSLLSRLSRYRLATIVVETSRTALTLNSFVYCRFGTDVFLLINSSVHQKINNILMYVEPRQGH